jgi:hypothetical protein
MRSSDYCVCSVGCKLHFVHRAGCAGEQYLLSESSQNFYCTVPALLCKNALLPF